MESCLGKRGIRSRGRSAASTLDTALTALYRSIEMSPDSQLGQSPPDSQLEKPIQLLLPARTEDHKTSNVGESVPFPDTEGKPPHTLLYGYYLPHQDLMCGNRGHALSARFTWKRYLGHLVPQPLDGVAVWTLNGGQAVVRTVVRNFFTGAYMVFDRFPLYGPMGTSER